MNEPEIEFLIVIAARGDKDGLINALADNGAKIINVVYGKGFVKSNELLKALGLVAEQNKVVLIGLLPAHKTDACFEILKTEFKFNMPNTGIAFTIPLNSLSF
jgi:hypothetical protein